MYSTVGCPLEAGGTRAEAGGTPVSPASSGHDSPFAAFMQWSNWLYAQTNTTGNLHLLHLAKLLLKFLTQEKGLDEKMVAQALLTDYQRGNRSDLPKFLKSTTAPTPTTKIPSAPNGLSRQARHQKNSN